MLNSLPTHHRLLTLKKILLGLVNERPLGLFQYIGMNEFEDKVDVPTSCGQIRIIKKFH